METLLWLSRSSTYVPKHIPSWMSTVNREVALSTADHDSPLSCFGLCFHHLQARCCKPEHSGLISLSSLGLPEPDQSSCRSHTAGLLMQKNPQFLQICKKKQKTSAILSRQCDLQCIHLILGQMMLMPAAYIQGSISRNNVCMLRT